MRCEVVNGRRINRNFTARDAVRCEETEKDFVFFVALVVKVSEVVAGEGVVNGPNNGVGVNNTFGKATNRDCAVFESHVVDACFYFQS